VSTLTPEQFDGLRQIADACYQTTVSKGFHEEDTELAYAIELAEALPMETNPILKVLRAAEASRFGNLLALMHGEVTEVHDVFRAGHEITEIWYEGDGERPKPEGVPIELADIVIRVFDTCGLYGIDIASAIADKMHYNTTRSHKHGNRRF
jgi:NTP pyrophosphatase (non-canonical NTP hydrolase)